MQIVNLVAVWELVECMIPLKSIYRENPLKGGWLVGLVGWVLLFLTVVWRWGGVLFVAVIASLAGRLDSVACRHLHESRAEISPETRIHTHTHSDAHRPPSNWNRTSILQPDLGRPQAERPRWKAAAAAASRAADGEGTEFKPLQLWWLRRQHFRFRSEAASFGRCPSTP